MAEVLAALAVQDEAPVVLADPVVPAASVGVLVDPVEALVVLAGLEEVLAARVDAAQAVLVDRWVPSIRSEKTQ